MDDRIPDTKWVWYGHPKAEDISKAELVYFRKKLQLQEKPDHFMVRLSADTRYKLYVNGSFVTAGPSKGDQKIWYYDRLDLGNWLQAGENLIGVAVLRYPLSHRSGNYSLITTTTPGLFLEGETAAEQMADMDRKVTCKRIEGFQIYAEDIHYAPLMIFENRSGNPIEKKWTSPDYDDSNWENVYVYNAMEMNPAAVPAELHCTAIIMEKIFTPSTAKI